MNKIKMFIALFFINAGLQAQIVGTDVYMKGDYVELGISGAFAYEGIQTATSPVPVGFHQRGVLSLFGIYSNPQMNGWSSTAYDGDFFTPGSPENGWGFEAIDSIGGDHKQANNCATASGMPGTIVGYVSNPTFISTDWVGAFTGSGLDLAFAINIKLNRDELFYTTTVSVTNNTGSILPEFYYYRNIDPDNNQSIGAGFTTTNTIMHNPPSITNRAEVSASQNIPWISSMAFVANGPNFRASKGGFSNRDGSDIWNGTGGLVTTPGAVTVADEAISLGYRILNFAPGATETFHFFTVFADSLLNDDFESIDLSYAGAGKIISHNGLGDTVYACGPIDIIVDGFNTNKYDWTWLPNTYLNTDTGTFVTSTPMDTITYTVTGTPIATGTTQVFWVTVFPAVQPAISLVDPGPQCSSYDLSTLVYTDLNSAFNNATFHFNNPLNAFDMSSIVPSLTIYSPDSVYLMLADTLTGCYDVQEVSIVWEDVLFNLAVTNTNCFDSTGTATVIGLTAIPGTYSISWSNGDTSSLALTNLPVGIITVTIDGPGGCISTATDTITENLFSSTIASTPATCGFLNGTVSTSVFGDASNTYTYLWNSGDTSNNLTGLSSGFYSVTITNQNGCINVDTITVQNVVSPFSLTNAVFDASCGTCSNGTIYTFISGSPAVPVTYLWSTGATTPNLFALLPGTYFVTATDASGCTYVDTFFIGYPLGVVELNNSFELIVFPNPSVDFAQINTSEQMNELQLIGMDGRIVVNLNLNTDSYKLNLTNLTRGVYSLRVKSGEFTKVVRLIKN